MTVGGAEEPGFNGLSVALRPLRRDDPHRLEAFHSRLSAGTEPELAVP
ncbi:MAG: hypothetical protein ACYDEN_07805 [Acidimicrobiales bacterium]